MSMRRILSRRNWLAVLVGWTLSIEGLAQAGIVPVSPFLPRSSAIAPGPAELPFEYVGFIQTAEGLQFRLRARGPKQFHPDKNRLNVVTAAFVKLDEPVPALDIVVRRFDAESGAVTVEHLGRTLILP